jgi:2-oxoglutarate dehydrogenase E2 component (dihydrolipoamide succinyltransferase)
VTSSPARVDTPATSSTEKLNIMVPTMGESITQGLLAKWSVKPGDQVHTDSVIASIETDKVNYDNFLK